MSFSTFASLTEEQAKPIEHKIELARSVFAKAFAVSNHRQAVAWSGGKDSTVLLDILMRFFPDQWDSGLVQVVYGNTGIEYPECVQFWKALSPGWGDRAHMATPSRLDEPCYKYDSQREIWDWATKTGRLKSVLKADGKLKSTKHLEALAVEMPGSENLKRWEVGQRRNYWWCVDQYGWPTLGKAFSKLMAHRINIDTFLKYSKSLSSDVKLAAYYKILKVVKISQACCGFLKKEPSSRVQAQCDVDVVFKGLLSLSA